jgi:6-phosphogluconolactonase
MASEKLEISETPQTVADSCADWILTELNALVSAGATPRIALSGGSTPNLMFQTFVKRSFDWSKVHIFWVDERCVPPTDSQSNYKHAEEKFLRPAAVPSANIHRIKGELPPAEGAADYLADLHRTFALRDGELPVFDIIHRGIGPDAHTASLFPGEPLIGDRTGLAAAVYVEKLKMDRVTLLPGVLLAAKKTVILAAGADKAEAIHQVLRGPEDPFLYPCQIAARGASNAIWFMDQAAAAKL